MPYEIVDEPKGRYEVLPDEYSSPTEGSGTFLPGIGSGISSAVRALGGGSLLESLNLPSTKEEADSLNAPLNSTWGGKIGHGVGVATVAAPTVLVPGANTYAGAAALGALSGGALTEGGIGDRAIGAAFGAGGGVVGKGIGDALGAGARWLMNYRATQLAAQQAANAQKDAAVQVATNSGYVIPPADVKPSFINELLNGISGKIKTAQEASARNQGVTNDLAKKAVGLSPSDALNAATLNGVRKQAGQAYDAVSNAGTIVPGKSYTDALDAIVAPYMSAAKSFPNAKVSPVVAEIEALRTPAFDAADAVAKIKLLRSDADAAYASGAKDVGKSLKAGADALEQAIDDHLAAMGPTRALADFRAARQLIAKTYSVQKGLNDTTGDVAASALAKQLAKGAPLSGDLKTIAQVGQAFPKATQLLKEAPKAISPLDFATAGISAASTGNAGMAGMLAARPAIRSIMLSKPYQSMMLKNSYVPGLLESSTLPVLASDAFGRSMVPAGITGGLLSVPANQ